MQQIYFVIGVLVALGLLGVGLYFSIKKHEAKMKTIKKKKGRRKYIPEYKRPGK